MNTKHLLKLAQVTQASRYVLRNRMQKNASRLGALKQLAAAGKLPPAFIDDLKRKRDSTLLQAIWHSIKKRGLQGALGGAGLGAVTGGISSAANSGSQLSGYLGAAGSGLATAGLGGLLGGGIGTIESLMNYGKEQREAQEVLDAIKQKDSLEAHSTYPI